jgi:hypothetical protein
MQIVIYNPASIDSVIAAACIMSTLEQPVEAYPAGNKVPTDNHHYHWVGVEPLQDKMKTFPGHHSGYFAVETRSKHFEKFFDVDMYPKTSEVQTVFDFEDEIIDELRPSVLRTLILDYRDACPGLESLWLFARLTQDFEMGVKDIIIEDQALLWDNYNAALSSLMTGNKFALKTYKGDLLLKDKLSTEYLAFMNNMKHQTAMMFETASIVIDKAIHHVPLINVNQSASPWLLRLISNTYNYGVTYEQRRGQGIYTTFSRIAGFDKVIMNEINRGGEKVQSCLSCQL